jgi:hypothetical protein
MIGGASTAAPEVVDNGAEPAEGLKVVGMTELWRAGGPDDEIFFGTLGAVRADADGNIYILDSQLSEIQVYAPDGEFLRTLGREGDGPGEMRNPADMFISADGTIHAVQTMPGRIIKITPDGLPAGETAYSMGPDNPAQFGVLIAARAVEEDMVLAGIRMVFNGGANQQTYFLARCDGEGKQKAALLEKKHEVNMAAFELDELAMDFVWSRLAVGPAGKVYAGPERNAYLINVYGADGSVERTISRKYETSLRNDMEKKMARQVIEAVGANYPRPPQKITIEDTEPVLTNLTVTDDGRIWTQTSNGNRSAPDGTWVVLDVFAADGKFMQQVALRGEHDPARDAVNIMPDGRVVVVVGALDAWLNQQGATGKEEDVQEGAPLEVICYQLDW